MHLPIEFERATGSVLALAPVLALAASGYACSVAGTGFGSATVSAPTRAYASAGNGSVTGSRSL